MRTFLARFKLAHKLLIASLGFALPMSVLLYYVGASFGAGIRAADSEAAGMRTLASLEQLAELLQRHARPAEIDAALANLSDEVAPELLSSIRTQARTGRGIAVVRTAIARLGDSSGLVLDPALDTHRLVDFAVLYMPKIQEELGGADSQSAVSRLFSTGLDASVEVAGKSACATYEAARAAFLKAPSPNTAQTLSDAGFALWREVNAKLLKILRQRSWTQERTQYFSVLLGLLSIGFAGGLVLIIARNVVRPLERVAEIAGEIAVGRLERAEQRLAPAEVRRLLGVDEIPSGIRDEAWRMFHAFRTMTHRLASLLFEVRKSGLQVGGSANQTAAAVRELEATVAEQASSTSSVAATSNEIFATVKDLAKTMGTVTQMSAEATELANAGVDSLGGINAAMDQLLASTAHVAEILKTIREQSVRITGVIGAITKIANRTNLLSLNAAIQAENAGERAAGFSVVAVEIRRLADQTAVAALDIEESIEHMQGAVEAGVAGVDQYAGQARSSSQTIAQLTADLGRLLECTQKLGPYFGEVNTGMQVQAEGAGHITAAMQELDEAARQTRDSLAGFRQVTESMREAVVSLDREVARFSNTS